MATRPCFEMRAVADGGAHTIKLGGELDMVASSELQDAIDAICSEAASRLVLDLSELSFMDLMGLRAVIFAKELCEWHRCELRLVPGPEPVQRVFELTELLHVLPFDPDDAGARDATPSAPRSRRTGAR